MEYPIPNPSGNKMLSLVNELYQRSTGMCRAGAGPYGIGVSVVEDTPITVHDIEKLFNPKVAQLVEGLTKISLVQKDLNASIQAENFRKMILTLNDDVRVILIKLADRLHNMQTMDSMREDKQTKIASKHSDQGGGCGSPEWERVLQPVDVN